MRDPRFDILFEPVKIGPVTAPNRFYQVPHCTGMGHRYPRSEAKLRAIKAEGGWGVVSTQETEIHPSSDLTPANEGRLWDDSDMPALRLMVEGVHEYGSLAAIQLAHNGLHVANRYARTAPMAPSHTPVDSDDPVQARAMDKSDIAAFRRWHRQAAKRAKACGFDIVYVYAGHDMVLLQHFLLARHNQRSDEYGGSFKNRLRLFREVIADTRDAIGDQCALAIRLAVDELLGDAGLRHDGEARDIIAALADEPDLWDVNLSGWENDSQTARFAQEGYQQPYTGFVKSLTNKPVVGVGRFTSPDTMVRMIAQGHLDFIGAARPSIADPFLPKKIQNGALEEIRECIGCNICVAMDNLCVPIRCTQNPTMGEEWRRQWHPEIMPVLKNSADAYLIVGGGPAGLEAASCLVKRGAAVTLAEAGSAWGGRVRREGQLPGLSEWMRIIDSRLWTLQQAGNANLYLESRLTADALLGFAMPHIVLATGAVWRADGSGRHHRLPLSFLDSQTVLTPDDLMDHGQQALQGAGPIVIFDDDHYYMANILAELAAASGRPVTFVTPAATIASWSENTLEQAGIQTRLLQSGVRLITGHGLAKRGAADLTLQCVYTGWQTKIECATLISVTARDPVDSLWQALQGRKADWSEAGIQTVTRIGDCLAPGIIAAAVYSGHHFARRAGLTDEETVRREDITSLL